MANVLLVDCLPGRRELVSHHLGRLGSRVFDFPSLEAVSNAEAPDDIDLLMISSENLDRGESRDRFRAILPATDFASVVYGEEPSQHSDFDHRVHGPIGPESLAAAVSAALKSQPRNSAVADLVASGESFLEAIGIAEMAQRHGTGILIVGEPGTGKTVLARHIYRIQCGNNDWTEIDCGASGEVTCDFLNQVSTWRNSSLLCLEQVEKLTATAQQQLLRTLDDPQLKESAQARVIATTSQPLVHRVGEGSFNPVLFHRLFGMTINLPPLRERVGEIEPLALHMLNQAADAHGVPAPSIPEHAMTLLMKHSWPGNCHELRHVMGHLALSSSKFSVDQALHQSLGNGLSGAAGGTQGQLVLSLDGSLKEIERNIVLAVIDQCNGNKAAAARKLEVSRRSIYRILNGQLRKTA